MIQVPANTRWYCPTPDRLVIALLVVECMLWLAERFYWFPFNWHKGWPVLIAVVVAGSAFLLLLLWFAASLIFRWRFQFSIRSLLVMVVVVAIPCTWLAEELRAAKAQAERQREAIATVKRLSGQISWTHPEIPGEGWLYNLLGDDFFGSVDTVYLCETIVTDADLEHLKGLTRLRTLILFRAQITDSALEHLKGLKQLYTLNLRGTNVTDVGLEHFKGSALRVSELDLSDTKVTDAGLENLKGSRLKVLELHGTQVTGEGVWKLHGALPDCDICR